MSKLIEIELKGIYVIFKLNNKKLPYKVNLEMVTIPELLSFYEWLYKYYEERVI